jgi:hypothetical protein
MDIQEKKGKYNIVDSIILFILAFLFTQGTQFFQASTFPVEYFALLYPALFFHLGISIFLSYKEKTNKVVFWNKVKLGLVVFIVLITLGRTFYAGINLRHKLGMEYPIHDNPIQLEAAINFLLQGKNFYTEDYLNTDLIKWRGWTEDPALYHFITVPFYALFSTLIYFPSKLIFGFFDERMVHLVMFFVSLFLFNKLVKAFHKKAFYLTLFVLNPLFVHFFIEGRNDIVVFSWVFLSMFFLFKEKLLWSSLFFGLAFSTKQSAWLLAPLYFFYIFFLAKDTLIKDKFLFVLRKTWPFFLSVALIFVPFLIWDGKSFIEDTVLFPAGNLATSLEIKGFGFSEILLYKNFVANRHSYYPFGIWQAFFCIPALAFLVKIMKNSLRISYLIFSYIILLFIFWFFSRFFADNYVGYLSMLFILGLVFIDKEKELWKNKQS